jgi:hypothetical protein
MPDASQYTQIKRLQAAQTASGSESPLKFRGPVGLSSYGFVPGFRSQFDVNVLKSNKLIPIYIPPPAPFGSETILVNTQYDFVCDKVGEAWFHTTNFRSVFTASTTGQYVIYLSGVETLYNVLSTSTQTTYITDSASQTPNYFTNGNTVSLTAGQKLYLMPKGSLGQTASIQISNSSPPILTINQTNQNFNINILGEGGNYYTLRPLRFANGSGDTIQYTFTVGSGINQVLGVTASTIPETAITDTVTTYGPGFIVLAPNTTIYLMPSSSSPISRVLRIAFDSFP